MRSQLLIWLFLTCFASGAARAQDTSTAETLRRVSALQARIDTMQRELDGIRGLLAPPGASAILSENSVAPIVTATFSPRPATKRVGCVAHAGLPDRACTPGAVMTRDPNVICNTPTGPRRHVTAAMKLQVMKAYGVPSPQPSGAYEIDHLIPLELGGDNAIENLWPEAASPAPGWHQKDAVENKLHKMFCAQQITLNRLCALSQSSTHPTSGSPASA